MEKHHTHKNRFDGGPPGHDRDHPRRRRRPLDYGALRLLLLALIDERPRHGYELIRAIEDRSAGHYTPSPGVIYPTLAWLDDMGFVATSSGEGRKSHQITEAGRAFLAANDKGLAALLTRDWSQDDEAQGDPIRAGMHAIKSVLRALNDEGEPDPALTTFIGQALQDTAQKIRARLGRDSTALPFAEQGRRPGRGAGLAETTNKDTAMDPIITRHRFDIRRRTLTVKDKTYLTPKMIRFVLTGEDLADFQSLAPDDHIKLFFQADGQKPQMRDYTPRAFDRENHTLTLDFAIHEAGPATQWAIDAEPGSSLEIGGPRGSAVVAPVFDWYLLIGDETALPALGRWVEEMPAGKQVVTLGLVTGADEEQSFATQARHSAHWVHRQDASDATRALEALQTIARPEGRGFIWIAAEAGVARKLRDHVLNAWQHPRTELKASGYWVQGQADAHDKLMD